MSGASSGIKARTTPWVKRELPPQQNSDSGLVVVRLAPPDQLQLPSVAPPNTFVQYVP